ncbi:MAG TPA: 30S ribosomal protein S9 [Candidatus Paceibacterota bacterium]|nr:30S ribosomal protein S9 [Candidatus Paceibacterota bacterium]
MTTATTTKAPAKKPAAKNYTEAVGRRKTAIARVRVSEASKSAYTINDRDITAYFPTEELRAIATSPVVREGFEAKFAITAKIVGGGIHAQAEAFRHGLSRALIKSGAEEKTVLKKMGFLSRDARKKERKHFGLKKARKASQWSKR